MTITDREQPTYAAGWYVDTTVPGTERWYDGTTWTDRVRPAAPQIQPQSATAAKRRWYKRKALVIPVAVIGGIVVVSGIAGALGGERNNDVAAPRIASQAPVEEAPAVLVDVPNVVGMTGSDAQTTLSALGFRVDFGNGDPTMPVTAQDVAAGEQAEEGSTVQLTLQEKPNLTVAQDSAIRSAKSYLSFMGFSRAGLIEQLTSQYGEGYEAADAEFAVATLEQTGQVVWNEEALQSAQSYLKISGFSRQGLFDQLTSQYGGQFTPEQANYALDGVGL
ncbi:Ltp family lipoprotein [Microbacterium sp.]|uniref:Ltp family lipoprotein n=1 Tax=Microbacterium sp. TaxID=51671 RepID=UPI0039E4283F